MDAVSSLKAPAALIRLDHRVTPLRLTMVLTILALALRLIHLGSRPLWLDEAFSAWFSNQSFNYLWHVLPTYEAHPPLFYSLLKLWRMAVGEGHAALRGLSVLIGTATVPLIMLIAFEQERHEPTGRPLLRAGLAGFLASCSPMLMVIDQEPRPYPLLAFAYALSILALLRLVRQLDNGEPGRWRSWLFLGASAALTCWCHALGLLYALCLGLALLPSWLRSPVDRMRLVRGSATAAMVALLYAPCLMNLASRTHDWGANWLTWKPSMLLQLLVLYTVPVEALTIGSAFAALAMALLIKRAIQSTWRSAGWNFDRLLLLLWLGPPLIAALISAVFEPVYLARTLSGTLIPAYLVIAGALARSDDERERRFITAGICIALLPAAVIVALRPANERWDLLSAYLSRNSGARDQIWLYPADSALPLSEAGGSIPGELRPIPEPFPTMHFKGPIRAGWPAVVSLTPKQASDFADDPRLAGAPVVWLVTRQSDIFDPNGDVPAALARVRRPGPIVKWGYIGVRAYYRR